MDFATQSAAMLVSLPLVVKILMLILTSKGIADTTENMVTLYRQGFLKVIPTAALVMCAAFVAYQAAGSLFAGIVAVCSIVMLSILGVVQREIVIRLRRDKQRKVMKAAWRAKQ